MYLTCACTHFRTKEVLCLPYTFTPVSVFSAGKATDGLYYSQLLNHLHDHLSLGMPLFEVGECVGDVRKGKNTVNHYL